MTDTSKEAVEALAAKHASWAAGSEACIDYPRADESMLAHDTLRALLAEREALRKENASLWERVKRWEPMADKSQWGCGGTTSATAAKGEGA